MSAQATAWAWSCDLPNTSKLILLACADIADNQNFVALQRTEIEARTGLSETTVRSAITKLADEGYITKVDDVVRRDAKDGQNTLVPLYRLEILKAGKA